ncbi:MAG: GNAT family N-acetyltransferase [Caldilineaceae bacterium]|nr:GNAT family N-acetyltransferase [Caldilineaceae bacterium]
MSSYASQAVTLTAWETLSAEQVEQAAGLWNEAATPEFALSPRLIAYNLHTPSQGAVRVWLATVQDELAGFVIANALHSSSLTLSATGWISALAVSPAYARQGIGTALLQTAEQWLIEQDAYRLMLGGDLRALLPGVPLALNSTAFFARLGYGPTIYGDSDGIAWDLARDMSDYQTPASVIKIPGAVRAAQSSEEGLLLDFLKREYPGRWYEEAAILLQEQARLSDWMLLWTERGVEGFCMITFEDSIRPIERFYPYELPRPWGHVGPVGISHGLRGQGYGRALMDAALRRLHNSGIKGCVIDCAGLVDFYAQFGFERYHAYQQMHRMA